MIIHASPLNPAEYFGACGFFELVATRNPSQMAYWCDGGLSIVGYDDKEAKSLIHDLVNARLTQVDVWEGKNSTRPFAVEMLDSGLCIHMDWWERRDGSDKTEWKCFAANQTALNKFRDLQLLGKQLVDSIASATECLQLSATISGRLGFDPRSAWSSLDTGFSPNDIKGGMEKVPTYPLAELLTCVAAQRWPFRFRVRQGTYSVWRDPLPLSVARVVAATRGESFTFFRAERAKGFNAFTYSRPGAAF